MKVHEYQAKSILARYGVAVPRGEVTDSPAEASDIAHRLGGRCVVKAQIHAGGRGKGGGVKLARDPDEAYALAKAIVGMTLVTPQTGPGGRVVRKVLIEEALDIDRELYLGITLDRGRGLPAMMVSKSGGMEIEQVAARDPKAIVREVLDPGLGMFPFQARKLAFAKSVVELGLALTVNTVIHRANIGRIAALVEMAAALGAGRVEIAHAQYYGWALRNRQSLMPTRDQVGRAMQEVETIRPQYQGRIVIDLVVPDYYARRPKACMGGWGRRSLNVTPSGRVLPCHAAETIPGLRFWSVRDRPLAEIWSHSPAFQAFRGTDWMP